MRHTKTEKHKDKQLAADPMLEEDQAMWHTIIRTDELETRGNPNRRKTK